MIPKLHAEPIRTVQDLATVFLANVKNRLRTGNISEGAAENYERDLGNFCIHFGALDISACRQHDLTQWLQANPGWRAVHTKRRAIRNVLACFRWAAEENLIPSCPYVSPKALRGQAAEVRRAATDAEYHGLVLHGSAPFKFALFFLSESGARTCEMREVRWGDVHLVHTDGPHILLAKHKTAGKTGKPRIIPLSRRLVRLLLALKPYWERRRRGLSDHVFLNCDGTEWNRRTFAKNLRRCAERAGLDAGVVKKVSGYGFRHRWACDAVQRGASFGDVAFVLGNSPEVVEAVYASHLKQRTRFISDVAARIGRK